MPRPRNFVTTEECARVFMSRSEHPKNLQRLYVHGFLDDECGLSPGFRLPSDPANCCDLCKELQNLVVRAIGPDLRLESTQALFFPGSQQYLVLKLHVPEDRAPVETKLFSTNTYFIERCFHIYSHPGVLCPWNLLRPYSFQKLDWAFSRLQECAKEHDCCANDPPALPTRVIKVGRGSDDIRLRSGGFCAHYICLSHCWGYKQPLVTSKMNINNHLARIVWKDMPLLYQDTVRLARQLGIEYVWIDSLCIIQDCSDDWACEAGRMKNVYGNSWLTIAGNYNPDCSSGILDDPCDAEGHARFASVKECLQYSGVTDENEVFSWIAVPADINTCNEEKHKKGACRSPLLTRGWVLQERLLSPRVLYFTASSLFWSCQKSRTYRSKTQFPFSEHLYMTQQDIITTIAGRERDAFDPSLDHNLFWLRIIGEFSRLKFTNCYDRLSALSGLAQRASQQLPSGAGYLAGLWSSSLFQGLSWYNEEGRHPAIHNAPSGILTECSRKRSQIHPGTPSWSWAAISVGVSFPQSPYHHSSETFHAEICGTECTPASRHDPTGRVSHGKIHLRGPISPIISSDRAFISEPDIKMYFDCPVHMDFDYLIDNKVKCLPLYTATGYETFATEVSHHLIGLILQPVIGKDYMYQRVGLLQESHYPSISDDPPIWHKRLSNMEDVIIV